MISNRRKEPSTKCNTSKARKLTIGIGEDFGIAFGLRCETPYLSAPKWIYKHTVVCGGNTWSSLRDRYESLDLIDERWQTGNGMESLRWELVDDKVMLGTLLSSYTVVSQTRLFIDEIINNKIYYMKSICGKSKNF